jgi:hypothetical protein
MTWSVADYSTTPAANIAINGVDIDEGCDAAGLNNALRQIMADIKSWTVTYAVSYPISIANGGTGQDTAAEALTALGAFPAAGGAIAGDSTIDGKLTRFGYGAHAHFASTSMTGARFYVQALGSDPTANPGDAVFEY